MRYLRSIALSLALALGLTACSGTPADPDTAEEHVQFLAMDTAMTLSVYGERRSAALQAAEHQIQDLEAQLSRTEPDSAVSRLNEAGTLEAGERAEDLLPLLEAAERYCRETGGAFDITVAPVVAAWGFAGGNGYHVPSPAELESLLERVDGTAVKIEGRTVTLSPGQSVDLGGIAKGYAADKLANIFRECETPRAMASLGGNVLAWGNRPDGMPWRVGVQDPARPGDQGSFAGILNLENAFAVTSGGYQRYFEQDGKRYHHIIDPATGYPASSGLTSVTVVAGCAGEQDLPGTMCDALSTTFFVLGEALALDFWSAWTGVPFDLVLITEDGRVVITEGLAESFTLDEGSGYTLEIVS